jgi:hypothetical protein
VATNANASGTPAKFDATPENVISMERSGLGSPPIVTAYASKKPKMPPPMAVTALMRMLNQ